MVRVILHNSVPYDNKSFNPRQDAVKVFANLDIFAFAVLKRPAYSLVVNLSFPYGLPDLVQRVQSLSMSRSEG